MPSSRGGGARTGGARGMAPLAARGAGWRGARGGAVARRPGRGAPSRGASSVLLCIQKVELNVSLVVCFAIEWGNLPV